MKNLKMKFYSYIDGKTQFSQIFLGFVLFFWGGGGGGGGGGSVDKSPRLAPVARLGRGFQTVLNY